LKCSPNWHQSLIRTLIPQEYDTVAITNMRYPVDRAIGLGKWDTFGGKNPCFDSNPEATNKTLRSSERPTKIINYDIRAPTNDLYKAKIGKDNLEALHPVSQQILHPLPLKMISTPREKNILK
jgi:hypothetical protein